MPSRLLKKTHMPTACLKQAFKIVALDRYGNHSRSKRSRSNVLPKYASARRFFARLASEIFLTSLQTGFFNNLLSPYSHHNDASQGPASITAE
jgi:hypothetical protein